MFRRRPSYQSNDVSPNVCQCSATVHLVITYSNVFNISLQHECSVDGAYAAMYELQRCEEIG
jgi:hypothetical protein